MTFRIGRLDQVATVRARIGWKALTASEYQDEGYVFLSTPNIKGSSIDFSNVNYISEFRYRESPELMLQRGDVLLAKDGSTLGIAALVRDLPREATVNGSIAVLRPHSADPSFLRYVLESAVVQGEIQRLKDGMGVPHLFQWDIRRLPVPLPPLDVQRRIADFLDDQVERINKCSELRGRQAALVGSQLAAVLDTAFRANVGDSEWRPLSSVMRYFQDGDWIEAPFITDAGIRLIQTGNIGAGRYREQGFKFISEESFRQLRCKEVLPGDVLISRLGSPVARACIAPDLGVPAITSVDVAICRPDPEIALAKYLVYFLSSPKHLADSDNLSRGATMQRLSRSQLGRIKVPVPSVQIQQMVTARLDRSWRAAKQLEGKLTASQDLLGERGRSLITAAVTGEFDVTTASPRAAEVAIAGVGGAE